MTTWGLKAEPSSLDFRIDLPSYQLYTLHVNYIHSNSFIFTLYNRRVFSFLCIHFSLFSMRKLHFLWRFNICFHSWHQPLLVWGPFLRQSPICCQSLWEPTQNLSFWSASDYLCRGGGVCLRWLVSYREGAWQLLVDTCPGASISHISYHYLEYSFNKIIWQKMASSQMKSSILHSISSFYTEPKYSIFSFLC